MESPPTYRLPRAWYAAPFQEFLSQSNEEVIGYLAKHSVLSIDTLQRDAWSYTIGLLKQSLEGRSGYLLLEFNIPRMGLRADAVLLVGGCVVVLELKVGESQVSSAARNQVWEYALDTKNFHDPSHDLPIVPVLMPTGYSAAHIPERTFAPDGVCEPIVVGPAQLPRLLDEIELAHPQPLDAGVWISGRYKPTPTIIEAARHLYANHAVADIVRTEADERSLSETARRVESLIHRAKESGDKLIVFVTGVPGAGKTLIGLNIATLHRDKNDAHAIFLSGNGPLVTVLREALTRDDVARRRLRGEKASRAMAAKPIKTFIQNVHHFRDDGLSDREKPPVDRIVIFDEAQRAWNREKAERWMRQRKGIPDFTFSEPEFLVECMNRHDGWAVVVCLVGGGQEIGSGEAGIGAWIDACVSRFSDWTLCVSDRLKDAEYAAGRPIERAAAHRRTEFFDDLHLAVSIRSFRAENVSAFVKALLDSDLQGAQEHLATFRDSYPLVVTRDLDTAKLWVRDQARGAERYGLLASSKAMRLRPHAIDIRVEADPAKYFLADSADIRSSYYLEECATEFQVQGLELDWAVVNWDADLRRLPESWSHHSFRRTNWQNIRVTEGRRNLINAYRVLLTRARQGMAIFVPPGSESDPTRLPEFYEGTFSYLRSIGIPQV